MRTNNRRRHFGRREDPATPPAGDPGNGGAPPATPPAPTGTLLDTAPATPPTGSADGDPAAWLPEKFRVVDAEGKLDEAASSRKLAESYKALEAHKGPLPQAPATPDDYKLEPPKDAEGKPVEGVDFEAFVADPLFKAFAADAHARGLSNEQLQFVVDKYLALAPELMAADQSLTLEEAKAELGKVWKDEQTFGANLLGAKRAIQGFGAEADDVPGSRKALMDKFGNDPDFLAFAAQVATEMKEDSVPAGMGVGGDEDVEALQKSEAYWNPQHPQHSATKAKVEAFYARKYGQSRRR